VTSLVTAFSSILAGMMRTAPSKTWMARIFADDLFVLPWTILVADRTTTVVTIVIVRIALLAMTVLRVMIATEMTVTTAEMIGLHIAATDRDPLLVAPTTMIVAPGLRPPGGRMIKGLQGTILIEHPALGTSEDATRRMIEVTTRGPRGTEMADGRAKRSMVPGHWPYQGTRTASVKGFFLPNLMVLVSTKIGVDVYAIGECTMLHGQTRWSLSRSR